jgi:adenine phosphoribosyltransferase
VTQHPDWWPHHQATLSRAQYEIDRLTRVQQDFPIPGVLFRDLTPVMADPVGREAVTSGLALAAREPFDLIAGLESRGFLFAAALAERLNLGVLAVRKPGKLPGAVLTEEFELEYGTAALQLHPDDVPDGARVLVVDDVLATGGTAAAAHRLLRRAGAAEVEIAVVIELDVLHGRRQLPGVTVSSLRQL